VYTILFTGLGSEYLLWRVFLNGDWDQGKENKWRVAQSVFPILMGSAVDLATQGNFLYLPILAASMWKLEFPGEISKRYITTLYISLQVLTPIYVIIYFNFFII